MMEAVKPLIMIVDDHPAVIEVVRVILEKEGYQVWTAINGRNALERLEAALARRRRQGDFDEEMKYLPDLILSDIMMPMMDGYEFYEKTRANPYLNHIPFIFLTAKQEDEDVRYGKELGVDDYLTKPIDSDDLLASVRGKLRRISQRRVLAAQAMGDLGKPSVVGVMILIGFILLIIFVTVVITVMWVG
jgi:CheY-like chemotaxis protein